MSYLNRCTFIGRVGADPSVRSANEARVASFNLAVSERYKDRNGESKENTVWVSIVAWRNNADFVANYVKKGSEIYVEGKFTTRDYTDANGVKKYITEIVVDNIQLLGGRPEGQAQDGQQRPPQKARAYGNGNGAGYGRGQSRQQSAPIHDSFEESEQHRLDADDLPF